ncbi:MAG: protein-glutamate O-methyltransferase CheR [Oceanicaulis sp.]|uniref:CheR family methyltransferase n=1 Tax=Glycocaulis sp. TaxID=1969725 RepID=UPI0025B881A1|nr:protein-glutamate O-methyltransferase CheR [Glycocaulis sp.]MCC5980102.1 protein-glutamate O-methyltransferase CheR [Oceanicaulis sp.]MCH8520544.1 protein-glutamate O-methyltransferase CheR [Glycocaulis sp.]
MLPENKYKFLAAEVKKRSGLVLRPEKGYLIESRLAPLARTEGLAGPEAVVDAMMRGDQRLCAAASEALATHETFFFRDKTPFDLFTEIMMPALRTARSTRPLKIWCAAASTGQEPYSLAMLIRETGGLSASILATDMCAHVLEKAKTGLYSQFEVQRGLAIQRLVKHFEQSGDSWRVKPELREMIRFEPGNLLDDFSRYGQQDIIFCRNVLIYFDVDAKAKILDRLAALLAPDGYLVLGAAETVVGLTDTLKPVAGQRGLYVRADAAQKPARPASVVAA